MAKSGILPRFYRPQSGCHGSNVRQCDRSDGRAAHRRFPPLELLGEPISHHSCCGGLVLVQKRFTHGPEGLVSTTGFVLENLKFLEPSSGTWCPKQKVLRTTTSSRQEKPHVRSVVKNTLETRGASFLLSCWEGPSATDTPVTSPKLQAGNLKHGDRSRVPARLRAPEHLSTHSVLASSP